MLTGLRFALCVWFGVIWLATVVRQWKTFWFLPYIVCPSRPRVATKQSKNACATVFVSYTLQVYLSISISIRFLINFNSSCGPPWAVVVCERKLSGGKASWFAPAPKRPHNSEPLAQTLWTALNIGSAPSVGSKRLAGHMGNGPEGTAEGHHEIFELQAGSFLGGHVRAPANYEGAPQKPSSRLRAAGDVFFMLFYEGRT